MCGLPGGIFDARSTPCLKITLNFTCAVLGSRLCGSAGSRGGLFKDLFFSYHFVLQRFDYVGRGWQPGLKYVCFPGESLSPGNLACLQWLRNEIMNL